MTPTTKRNSTRRQRRPQERQPRYVPITDPAVERYYVRPETTEAVVVLDPSYQGELRCVKWIVAARKGRPPFQCVAYSIARKGSGALGAYIRLAWIPK